MTYTQEFLDFIDASPSSYHAAAEVARQLVDAGFTNQSETAPWDASPGGHVMVRGGAVMAWYIPEGAGRHSGFRIVGSHTDSPGFALKPEPDFEASGFSQVGVEVYGGPLLHTWFDRELGFAGQLVLRDGTSQLVSTGPIARIPSLAIHLYRSDEFKPDRQRHLQPVLSTVDKGVTIADIIAEQAGTTADQVAAFNLVATDCQRGQVFGAGERFIAAGRLDNLSSVYASLVALKNAATATGTVDDDVLFLAAFDHEEVGSGSRYGAAGPILADVLTRTARALGADEETRHQMFARSLCVSADAAHSVHPNYADKHDPHQQPIIGAGPVTKINGNQRYASNATSVAAWEAACDRADVPVQRFVGNNDVPCGTTIGPLTATRLGIDTVDVGVPLLSMHSAREMVGERDQLWLAQAIEAYLVG